MTHDKLAVNQRVALRMFWEAGFNTEWLMMEANKIVISSKQCTNDYWLAEDVSGLIESNLHLIGE